MPAASPTKMRTHGFQRATSAEVTRTAGWHHHVDIRGSEAQAHSRAISHPMTVQPNSRFTMKTPAASGLLWPTIAGRKYSKSATNKKRHVRTSSISRPIDTTTRVNSYTEIRFKGSSGSLAFSTFASN